MKTEEYIVTVARPDGVTRADMKEYIHDAVVSHRGQFDTMEPLFYMDRSLVRVNPVPLVRRVRRTGMRDLMAKELSISEQNKGVRNEIAWLLGQNGEKFTRRGFTFDKGGLRVELGPLKVTVARKLNPPREYQIGRQVFRETHERVTGFYYKNFRDGTISVQEFVSTLAAQEVPE